MYYMYTCEQFFISCVCTTHEIKNNSHFQLLVNHLLSQVGVFAVTLILQKLKRPHKRVFINPQQFSKTLNIYSISIIKVVCQC